MNLSKGLLVALVTVAGIASAGGTAAASPKATFLGSSLFPAVTDGQSAIILGTGSDVRIFHDVGTSPIRVVLPEGCRVVVAKSGTGASDCYASDVPALQLVSLKTGAARPLPGADAVTGRDIMGNSFKMMGSRWIAGVFCVPGCESYALQWQTGAVRMFPDNHQFLPVTVLDSPALTIPAAAPYVTLRDDELKSTWTYHRGTTVKRLPIKAKRGTQISSVQVNGWRTAWITQQGRSKPTVTTLNVKTGHRVTIPIARFQAVGHPIAPLTSAELALTNRQLVVSYVPRGSATPDGGGTDRVVTGLPWPR